MDTWTEIIINSYIIETNRYLNITNTSLILNTKMVLRGENYDLFHNQCRKNKYFRIDHTCIKFVKYLEIIKSDSVKINRKAYC